MQSLHLLFGNFTLNFLVSAFEFSVDEFADFVAHFVDAGFNAFHGLIGDGFGFLCDGLLSAAGQTHRQDDGKEQRADEIKFRVCCHEINIKYCRCNR